MTYDYIIVGSGAAGSVMANRLSENPHLQILVLEAGGSDWNPVNLVPKGFYFTMSDPKYVKFFETDPLAADAGAETWTRGRIIGGSTTVNGMVWNRGWAPDYDAIEQAGNPGWGWDTFRAAYRSIEDHQLGANEVRGAGGPVPISVAGPREEISDAFIESAGGLGMEFQEDLNGSDDERVGYVSSNVGNGLRASAAKAFLHPAGKRKNVTILQNAEVSKVLLEGRRAIGVRARHNGQVKDFRAAKEILLAGGALDTPLLLERSGIGNAEVLHRAGVKLQVESPNVGERLHEHRGNSFQYSAKGALGYNHEVSSALKQGLTGAKYLKQRDGVMSFGGYNILFYFKADPNSERPDTQGLFTPISISAASLTSGKVSVESTPGMMLLTYSLRPTSQGSIHITGELPENKPRIIPNFLSTEHDRRLVTLAGHKVRELMSQGPITRYMGEESRPGQQVSTNEDFIHNALHFGGNGYHTLGTAAVGPNDDDVVDARLRVRGTEGLRVIDASVFPHMPSGNNNAPTQALAWQAAKLIQEDNE